MKKLILFVLGAVCVLSSCNGQTPPQKMAPLKIGDTVPDVVFHHMLNYKDSTARLSDFEGKLVILDFWNTWCGSCIEAFPKMDSLQKQFEDKIQIILVNAGGPKFDGKERVETTLKNLKKRTGFSPDLPISILDTTLNEYFPHKSVPHEIWIDPNRKITAITTAKEVTASHIETVTNGKIADIEMIQQWKFNKKIPLLVNANGRSYRGVIFRSLFTTYIPGLGHVTGKRLNDANNIVGFYSLNSTLQYFVSTAYAKLFDKANYRTVLRLTAPSVYTTKYCYDLSVPPVKSKDFDLSCYLRSDLKKAFNISAHMGKKKYQCLILEKPVNNIEKFYTKYNKMKSSVNERNIKKYMHHWPIKEIVRYFSAYLKIPIIDETELTQNLDVNFPPGFKWSDKKSVMSILSNIFKIKKENRVLPVVVISNM